MRYYHGPEGDQRIWFDDREIEGIADDELRRAGLSPTLESPVTDLERLVEGHLGARLDQYATLPPDVLGLTEFAPGQPPAVSINQDLTGAALDDELPSPGQRGRWRATLAHEAGHILLHRSLFELNPDQGQLFGEDTLAAAADSPRLMRCLKRDVGYQTRAHDWREVQANKGMAALLMPRTVFGNVAATVLARDPVAPGDTAALSRVTARLAEVFGVSRQAARIRLETLNLVPVAGADDTPSILGDGP